MTVTKCISSQLMTELLIWRNPQGNEAGWGVAGGYIHNEYIYVGKIFITGIGVSFLALVSTVETVAYSILSLLSLALYPIEDAPLQFFVKLLESSSFTILWSAICGLLANPFLVNVITHESMARLFVSSAFPELKILMRPEDANYIRNWLSAHQDIPSLGIPPEEIKDLVTIEQGAEFIQRHILENASENTLTCFKEMEPSLFPFILAKAVYIYAAGTKKDEEIPLFFKSETRQLIESFREKPDEPEIEEELQRLFSDPTQFATEPKDADTKAVFDELRQIGSGELQNNLLATRCWQKAIELLPLAG
jgi:hypothetical protein